MFLQEVHVIIPFKTFGKKYPIPCSNFRIAFRYITFFILSKNINKEDCTILCITLCAMDKQNWLQMLPENRTIVVSKGKEYVIAFYTQRSIVF